MTFRAILVFLGCALAAAHAASDTYKRFEAFDTPPNNWRYFNPNQGFGFFPTSSTTGLAGGFFFPKPYTAYYADTHLNGAFNRGTPITASGRIQLDELSFDPNYTNTVYIAHFRKGSTNDMFVNIVGMSLTGDNQGFVNVAPVIQFSNGNAFVGKSASLPVNSKSLNWSYTWTPNGGGPGYGELQVKIGIFTRYLTLTSSSVGLDYSLDSFGLYQPAFVQPNSNSYSVLFVDSPGYTAFVGSGPSLHVRGPKTIHTASSPIIISGTTHIPIGNRINGVIYTVVHNGHSSRTLTANGTQNWSASVRVPTGTSRILITAVGDNDLTKTVTRTVSRVP